MAPISVCTSLPDVTSIALVVLENPNLLAACYRIPQGTINAQHGIPVWDVLAKYLGTDKPLGVGADGAALQGVSGNAGIADP